MGDLVQNYDFDDAIHGNTYESVIFNLPQEPGFNLSGSKIYMQLKKKPGQVVAAEFSTQNNKIELTGNYTFSFIAQVIEVIADTYFYDILIIFEDGRRKTYIGGKWTIQPAVTHKP